MVAHFIYEYVASSFVQLYSLDLSNPFGIQVYPPKQEKFGPL